MNEKYAEVFIEKAAPYCAADKISKVEGFYTKRIVRVLGKLKKRHMFKCRASLKNNCIDVYMDLITGSCYDEKTGDCFSSANLKLIVPTKRVKSESGSVRGNSKPTA
jgi:hypothetical protein